MEVNIHEAKTHLSRLLQRVAAGEEVTIARSGCAPGCSGTKSEMSSRLRPLRNLDRRRFRCPLPDDLLAAFYGGEIPKLESKPKKTRGRRRK
jgi:hypothetical protein